MKIETIKKVESSYIPLLLTALNNTDLKIVKTKNGRNNTGYSPQLAFALALYNQGFRLEKTL